MKTFYAREPLEKSIFLAGPTPRKHTTTPSWRPEALRLLDDLKFNGTVFIPEDRDGTCQFDYDGQVNWEWEALNQATVIVFWVPRDLEQMPAFTTNVEFGLTVHSCKTILGYPHNAPKMSYLQYLAARYHVTTLHTLPDLMAYAVAKTNDPFGVV